jgi:hypothetical protein
MSVTLVLPLFRTRMDDLGYREWTDGFNVENIPSTIIDKSYHLEVNDGSGGVINQHVQNISMPITLRVFRNGFRDPASMRDEMLGDMEAIVCDILLPAVRLSSGIKNIVFDSFSLLPLDVSNDNSVILEMNFTNIIMLQGFN